ncbi:NACHT domain-containing protein [Sphingobacterium sp. UBA5996]|uniref:NACHT domain-containing protein n=1 Tax=Sphingobacterium sp. UBA5996 TaxID=1947505 RepID=UPI0025CD7CF3|nr:NACHT domain-containing protein [Sphingobacterium sp. UBA5996]
MIPQKLSQLQLFKSNTDAIATNRGFYYQYLSTVDIWLTNFIKNNNHQIFCEREEDILEVNIEKELYKFRQIKCYAQGFGLNSPEIKESLLNFFKLFLKYKIKNESVFIFQTNAIFKPRAGQSLKKWYLAQKVGNYSIEDYLSETRDILSKLVNDRLKERLKKVIDLNEKVKLKQSANDINSLIASDNFETFLKLVRWEFVEETNTSKALSDLIRVIISKLEPLLKQHVININQFLSFLLQTVIERSTEINPSNRLLDNVLFDKILNDDTLEQKLKASLRPEILAMIQNDILILNKLDNIHDDLTHINDKVTLLTKQITTDANINPNSLSKLKQNSKSWFSALGHKLETHESQNENSFSYIINIPRRRGYERILIMGVDEIVELRHLSVLKNRVDQERYDEAWLITFGRISSAAKNACSKGEFSQIFVYHFDELIDQDVDFTQYFEWLEKEVKQKNIDQFYVPLFATQKEIDQDNRKIIATNTYLVDDHVDQWIDDPVKKHISVLGEFGTGKTWFTLHYASVKLKEYLKSKRSGLKRSRIPIFIPLRDYAKAASIESLLSEFFFRKHNSPIPTYEAFLELNRLGKLLIIFDGFDEMADKIDAQKMVNNFWELAKVVTDNSKVILTCRNEHFPEAKSGRELLSAELKASTHDLLVKAPQFEVLELEKLNDQQISTLLAFHTNTHTINKILKNKTLIDLARRPIMIDLILTSLADIENDKPVDIARIYLYAIKNKLDKDMRELRTFTSISDKIYFLCEISWEMLNTNNMSMNYRLFPDHLRAIFGEAVQERKEMDHWQYDMMGQTLLIRNDDGDYKPAHRSFLEFFAAYKFAGELGILDADFKDLAQPQCSEIKESYNYIWREFFKSKKNKKLGSFAPTELSEVAKTFGKAPITKAILDLMIDMISISSNKTIEVLEQFLKQGRGKTFEEINYTITNIAILLTTFKNDYFVGRDLSKLCLRNFELPSGNDENDYLSNESALLFHNVNFSGSDLKNADFGYNKHYLFCNFKKSTFRDANLSNFSFKTFQVDSIALSPDRKTLALGSSDELILLNARDLSIIYRCKASAWYVRFSNNGKLLAYSEWGIVKILDTETHQLFKEITLSKRKNPTAQEKGRNLWTGDFAFSADDEILIVGCNNAVVYEIDLRNNSEVAHYNTFSGVKGVDISSDGQWISAWEFNGIKIWNRQTGELVYNEHKSKRNYTIIQAKFHPSKSIICLSYKNTVKLFDLISKTFVLELPVKSAEFVFYSEDNRFVFISSDYDIKKICLESHKVVDTWNLKSIIDKEIGNDLVHRYLDFGTIEDLAVDSIDGILYIAGRFSVLSYDLKEKKILEKYLHLFDLTTVDFSESHGMEPEMLTQISKNGAIVYSGINATYR